MALDGHTAAQEGTCAVIKVKCCVYIPDFFGSVSAALDDVKSQVKVCLMIFLFGLLFYHG